MIIKVHVRDQCFPIFCGNGSQKIRWLADVALHRYEHQLNQDPGLAKGMRFENGQYIGWDYIIKDTLEENIDIWVILKEDLALIEAEQLQLEE